MTMVMRGCVVAVVFLAAVACDKVPLTAPTNSTITLTAPIRNLEFNGTTVITATVLESSGSAVQNGTTVRFSTNLGSVDPIEAQTTNGLATTTLHAGTVSGVAQVRATSGAAGGGSGTGTGGTTVSTNVIDINVGAASAASVSLSASRTALPASGGTVTIIATVVDATGNRLRNVPVSFSSTSGTLSQSAASTDVNGEASIVLTAAAAATVTARVGAGDSARTATVSITLATANSLALSAAPSPVTAGAPVTLTITSTVGSGNVAPEVSVDWGDGTSDQIGTVGSSRTAVHIYASAGNYTIRATGVGGGEVAPASMPMVVNAPVANSLTLSATPLPATVGATVTLTITTTVGAGNVAPQVSVDWGDGTVDQIGTVATSRTAVHVYESAGTFTIRASGVGGGDVAPASMPMVVNARPTLIVSLSASVGAAVPGVGVLVTFTATVTPTTGGADMVESVTWSFGDGSAAVVTSGPSTTRVYSGSGPRTTTVTVRTTDGRTATARVEFIVPPF